MGPDLALVRTDLRQCAGLPERYDCVVHCAADVPATCPDPDEMFRSNVEGTRRVLAHAAAAGARRAIYLSSMSVYGTISAPVVGEDTPPAAPDLYGRSKAEGERLLAEWAARTGGAGVAIRLPGVVGAGGRNNFLCETLRRILGGEAINARNPDAPFNNVVHVEDLALFIAMLANHASAGSGPVTVAAREPLPMREVLARLFAGAGRPERITWSSGGKPFLISFERAAALGFQAATVADGVERFVADVLKDAARA